jgi:hypothetical protein
MRTHRGPRIDATILGAASILALAMGGGATTEASDQVGSSAPPSVVSEGMAPSDLAGVWTSTDGTVRLELGSDGRYERSITGRDKVAHGTYRIDALSMHLRDDSGLRTTVTIYDGALDMAGHQLHRS